jgi:hypothetical protein
MTHPGKRMIAKMAKGTLGKKFTSPRLSKHLQEVVFNQKEHESVSGHKRMYTAAKGSQVPRESFRLAQIHWCKISREHAPITISKPPHQTHRRRPPLHCLETALRFGQFEHCPITELTRIRSFWMRYTMQFTDIDRLGASLLHMFRSKIVP